MAQWKNGGTSHLSKKPMVYSDPNAVAIGGEESPPAMCAPLQLLEKLSVCMSLELNLIKSAPGDAPSS